MSQRTRDKWAYQRQGEILAELRVLRELALVAIRFPDLTEEERKLILDRIQKMLGEDGSP